MCLNKTTTIHHLRANTICGSIGHLLHVHAQVLEMSSVSTFTSTPTTSSSSSSSGSSSNEAMPDTDVSQKSMLRDTTTTTTKAPTLEYEEVSCCRWQPFCICAFTAPLSFTGM